MKPLDFRCAQLDLGRQMETIPFIHRLMDLLSQNGFNTLFLYLEDRIITKTYPYPSPDEGYTPEQIRELVAYAQERHLELIPCVATLGHAERFLRHPQMKHLAELQGDAVGRFGTQRKLTFCPTNPDVQSFLRNYLHEVAELFPSSYFHIGLDEFWDFGLCPRCHAIATDFAGEQQLFLNHILNMRNILQEVGKKTMLWSDMLENYPDIIQDIPRDVTMVEWQYQRDVRCCQAHFNNSTSHDNLAQFQKLGFSVIIASIDESLINMQSFLEYAQPYDCVKGAFLTAWEKRDAFWLRWFPLFAQTGQILQGKNPQEALAQVSRKLFGVDDPLFLAALELANSDTMGKSFNLSRNALLFTQSYAGIRDGKWNADKLMLKTFQTWKDKLPKGQDILDDLMGDVQKNILAYEIKRAAADILDFGLTPARQNALQDVMSRYLELVRKRIADWNLYRPGIKPNAFADELPDIQKNFECAIKTLQRGSFLKIRFTHNDWRGKPEMKVSLNVSGTWAKPFPISVRGDDLTQPNVDVFIPLAEDLDQIQAVRLEGSGFGGVGVCYLELRQNGKTIKVPTKILETDNQVTTPENILTNDLRWCFLGDQNMQKTFRDKARFTVKHRVDIQLTEC